MGILWRLAWDDEGLAASEPLALETLQRLAASGKVTPQTLARSDSDEEWRSVSAIPELYGALFGGLFDDLFGEAPPAPPSGIAANAAPSAPPSPANLSGEVAEERVDEGLAANAVAASSVTPVGEYSFSADPWSEPGAENASPAAVVDPLSTAPPKPAPKEAPRYDGPPPAAGDAFGGAMSAIGGTLEKRARQAKLYAQIVKIESMDKSAAMERLGKAVAALPEPIQGGEGFVKDIKLIEEKAAEQDANSKGFFGLKAKGVAAALRRRLPDLYLRLADAYLALGINAPARDRLAAELEALEECKRRVAALQLDMDALRGEIGEQSEKNRDARGKAAAYFRGIGKPEAKKEEGL